MQLDTMWLTFPSFSAVSSSSGVRSGRIASATIRGKKVSAALTTWIYKKPEHMDNKWAATRMRDWLASGCIPLLPTVSGAQLNTEAHNVLRCKRQPNMQQPDTRGRLYTGYSETSSITLSSSRAKARLIKRPPPIKRHTNTHSPTSNYYMYLFYLELHLLLRAPRHRGRRHNHGAPHVHHGLLRDVLGVLDHRPAHAFADEHRGLDGVQGLPEDEKHAFLDRPACLVFGSGVGVIDWRWSS